jgi:tetratricopeptide (TPR) repeat protein
MYEHYTWGWSLVHFLMSEPASAKKFQRFFIGLPTASDVRRVPHGYASLQTVEAADVWLAFRDFMGLETAEPVVALDKAWHAYVGEKLELVSARGFALAAVQASEQGRTIRAKRLFKEALDRGCTDPVAMHRYAQLLARGDEDGEAFELWKKAIALDPLNADFYHSYGLALKRQMFKEEGERLIALAKEIDPDIRWWDDMEEIDGEGPAGD